MMLQRLNPTGHTEDQYIFIFDAINDTAIPPRNHRRVNIRERAVEQE